MDDQDHLLSCSNLPNKVSTKETAKLYSNNVDDVIDIIRKLQQNINIREQMIEDSLQAKLLFLVVMKCLDYTWPAIQAGVKLKLFPFRFDEFIFSNKNFKNVKNTYYSC